MSSPLKAEDKGWFATPEKRDAQVEMLRSLFRLPVEDWQVHLASNETLLTDEFLDRIEQRVRWGIEKNHIDDAFRFALVGDLVLRLRGRIPVFQAELRHLFLDAGVTLQINPYLPGELLVTYSELESNLLHSLLKSSITEWPNALEKQQELLTPQFLDRLRDQVRLECESGSWSWAMKFALLGDLAATIVDKESDLRVYVVLNAPADYRPTVPMDADPKVIRNGFSLWPNVEDWSAIQRLDP